MLKDTKRMTLHSLFNSHYKAYYNVFSSEQQYQSKHMHMHQARQPAVLAPRLAVLLSRYRARLVSLMACVCPSSKESVSQ